jgi:hypothetical protein
MFQQWFVGLALASLPFWWGEPVNWELENVTQLTEMTGSEEIPFNAILSPDGSAVAWEEANATCVYRFETEERACYGWPGDAGLRSSRYNLPTWSPDGRYIAQTENFFMMFRDSDIWTLDTQTGTFTDRTDENYFGSLMSSDQPDDLPLDYLPTWNPATGELYFFRSQEREPILSETGYTLQLYKMGADAGEPELVRDLTLAVPGPFAVYRPVAFSDDGSKLALLVLPQNYRESPGTGVWVLDFANGGTEMVANLSQITSALPEWAREGAIPMNVQWAGDDLVIWTENPQYVTTIARTPLYLETETGVVTSLIDYSSFSEPAEYYVPRPEVSVYDNPITGAVLPGGDAYWLMVSPRGNNDGGMAVFSLPFPGVDGEPTLIAQVDEARLAPGQDALPTTSGDGKLLMLHTLFTLRAVES